MKKKIIFEIFRNKNDGSKPGFFQDYSIEADDNMTILDCLDFIKQNVDHSLAYRCSCHHSCCGTCVMRINEKEKLACITPVFSFDSESVKIEPLKGLKIISDLVVDMKEFYDNIQYDLNYLRISENYGKKTPDGIKTFTRFENCIECGSCVSACPVSQKKINFIGPASLAAINNEILKNPAKSKNLLNIAKGETGVKLCERAIECSRVCPTKVYPAKHINDLIQKHDS